MKPGKKPFLTKKCPDCGIVKDRSEYYKKGTTVAYRCKPCSLELCRTNAPKYFGKYSEYRNGWRFKRYQTDPAYRERIAAQKKARYDAKIEAINAARRERWRTDPFNPARLYFRRKDVNLRTPPWVSKEALLAFYANCPTGMEVDHVIPLKGLIDGRKVSGLHVPWNLQYLTKVQNRKKGNRISEATLLSAC